MMRNALIRTVLKYALSTTNLNNTQIQQIEGFANKRMKILQTQWKPDHDHHTSIRKIHIQAQQPATYSWLKRQDVKHDEAKTQKCKYTKKQQMRMGI